MVFSPAMRSRVLLLRLLNDPDVKLIGLTGKAGTGKTLLALASH